MAGYEFSLVVGCSSSSYPGAERCPVLSPAVPSLCSKLPRWLPSLTVMCMLPLAHVAGLSKKKTWWAVFCSCLVWDWDGHLTQGGPIRMSLAHVGTEGFWLTFVWRERVRKLKSWRAAVFSVQGNKESLLPVKAKCGNRWAARSWEERDCGLTKRQWSRCLSSQWFCHFSLFLLERSHISCPQVVRYLSLSNNCSC